MPQEKIINIQLTEKEAGIYETYLDVPIRKEIERKIISQIRSREDAGMSPEKFREAMRNFLSWKEESPKHGEPTDEDIDILYFQVRNFLAQQKEKESEKEILMNAADLICQPILPIQCEDCEDDDATQTLTLDIRSLGQGFHLGHYCDLCTKNFKERFSQAFPK